MSEKKQMRRAAKAAREKQQQKRAMKTLTIALSILVVLGIILFGLIGNVF